MKKVSIVIQFLILLYATGCSSGPGQAPGSITEPREDTLAPYFPVRDFLLSEIRYVDSLPVGILQYKVSNGKTDTSYITLDSFHLAASEFLAESLEMPRFRNSYVETAFFDQSTGSNTFMYQSNNEQDAIRRIDVLSKAGAAYDEVTSIFMEKYSSRGDTLLSRKMTWHPRKKLNINTSRTLGPKTISEEQLTIVWDNWKEE